MCTHMHSLHTQAHTRARTASEKPREAWLLPERCDCWLPTLVAAQGCEDQHLGWGRGNLPATEKTVLGGPEGCAVGLTRRVAGESTQGELSALGNGVRCFRQEQPETSPSPLL